MCDSGGKRNAMEMYMVGLRRSSREPGRVSQSSSEGSSLSVSGFWPHSVDSNASHILLFHLTMDIFLVSVYQLVSKLKL